MVELDLSKDVKSWRRIKEPIKINGKACMRLEYCGVGYFCRFDAANQLISRFIDSISRDS